MNRTFSMQYRYRVTYTMHGKLICNKMLTDVGSLLLWLLSGILCISGDPECIDELNLCYELFNSQRSHSEAGTFCRARNGTLATIPDLKAQHYISHLIRSEGRYGYWIGGKLDVMDQLTWVDGTTYPGQWKMCRVHKEQTNFARKTMHTRGINHSAL